MASLFGLPNIQIFGILTPSPAQKLPANNRSKHLSQNTALQSKWEIANMFDLIRELGQSSKPVFHNLNVAQLVEQAVKNGEGLLSDHGAFVVQTGKYTGRSPNDKWIVRDEGTDKDVWWGPVNQPMSSEVAHRLRARMIDYLKSKTYYVQDCFAGADKTHRLPIRVVTERAWHSGFAHNMFVRAQDADLKGFEPKFSVLHAPGFKADPARDGTVSEAAIIIDFASRLVMICGTEYAGEIKKSIFSVLNYLLPKDGVLGMHCSANQGSPTDVAIFFGLSGTGKTTLSADPRRHLIGDDEHGWSDDGVFNFEGGCYAKVIRLNAKDEPEIFGTTQKFGSLLENVVIDETSRKLDLDDARLTENTRASYDISVISNAKLDGIGGHPKNIVMLTCDAFGVLPPIARLTPEQAMYHFLSGYTARVSGTERGVTEPAAVFSACFGAPFMPRHPNAYAQLLRTRMQKHQAQCWLVNTGWSGGPYGVGERMKIKWTRALLDAALSGELGSVPFKKDPYFKVEVPTRAPGVPSEILDPRLSWKSTDAYDAQAKKLVDLFQQNFRAYENAVSKEVMSAQPTY